MRFCHIFYTAVLYSIFLSPSVVADTLTPDEQRISAYIDTVFPAYLDRLVAAVNKNSGTRNLTGVRANGADRAAELDALGFEVSWIDMPADMDRAGHLYAIRKGTGGGPNILLIGHLDTVFPVSSDFQTVTRRGDRLYGPGVADMKGGNAIIITALQALNTAGILDKATIRVFLTGDEESVGMPLSRSRSDLIRAAKDSDIALNFEGGALDTAVIGRRGTSRWRLHVKGATAHSSRIFTDSVGAGAIFEASRILQRFYTDLRTMPGLTYNPGVIAGGTHVSEGQTYAHQSAYGKTNVVAGTVTIHGGLRFMNAAQKEQARDRMRAITRESLPKTSAEIIFNDRYPAMEQTQNNEYLLTIFSQLNTDMGYAPVSASPAVRRGAADISFVAPHVAYAMDGLGAIGGDAHSEGEWLHIERTRFAAKRSTLFLYRLLTTPGILPL